MFTSFRSKFIQETVYQIRQYRLSFVGDITKKNILVSFFPGHSVYLFMCLPFSSSSVVDADNNPSYGVNE